MPCSPASVSGSLNIIHRLISHVQAALWSHGEPALHFIEHAPMRLGRTDLAGKDDRSKPSEQIMPAKDRAEPAIEVREDTKNVILTQKIEGGYHIGKNRPGLRLGIVVIKHAKEPIEQFTLHRLPQGVCKDVRHQLPPPGPVII